MATLAWRDTWWRARFEIQFNALPNMGFDHQPNSCLTKGCAGRCFKMSTFCLIGDVSFDLCISCGLRPLPLSRLKTRGTGSFGLCPRGLFLGDWVGVVVGVVVSQKKRGRFTTICGLKVCSGQGSFETILQLVL